MTQLKIDPEFKNLIPRLSEEELTTLEQNILSHGRCRDSIIAWKDIIIDGHNRYAICQKYGIHYETTHKSFASRKEAELWIIQNQLGRRNITDAARIELAAHKNMLQKPPGRARTAIAKDAGVSEQTVQKYMTIKKLGDPSLLSRVLKGTLKISTAHGMLDQALEVTTRTVSDLCKGGVTFKISEEHRIKTVHANIGRIEKLYEFLMDIPAGVEDDAARICKKFRKQVKVLGV